MFLTESIGKAAEEPLLGLDHFHGRVFGLVCLWSFRMYQDGVLSFVEAIHLGAQVTLVAFPFHRIGELLEVGLSIFEQLGHGAVCHLSLLDVFTRSLVDGYDGGRVAIYQCYCQEKNDGNDGVAHGYLEGDMVVVHTM